MIALPDYWWAYRYVRQRAGWWTVDEHWAVDNKNNDDNTTAWQFLSLEEDALETLIKRWGHWSEVTKIKNNDENTATVKNTGLKAKKHKTQMTKIIWRRTQKTRYMKYVTWQMIIQILFSFMKNIWRNLYTFWSTNY